MEPSHSLCFTSFFFSTLDSQGAQYCFALGSSHHQFNKSDQQNHFHPWLPYFWTLQMAVEVWVVRLFSIGNTWWSFNVCIESLTGTVKTAACDAAHVCAVMMNGCLVCRFYGVLVVHFTVAGGPAEWDVSWRGQTEVMYSYRRPHSLPVILPIWGHQGAIKNH